MDFNKIVSLDCKQFGEKNVLWIVDTFYGSFQESLSKQESYGFDRSFE